MLPSVHGNPVRMVQLGVAVTCHSVPVRLQLAPVVRLPSVLALRAQVRVVVFSWALVQAVLALVARSL